MEQTIKATITSCNTHVSEAYDRVKALGGTIPSQKNLTNLATAIRSLG